MSTIFNISDKIKLANYTPSLLNFYGGAAAAYSLRKLDSLYSGSAVRVRRASDNAEQDIAFANNELDTATLETFASGTDAFVTTWYDQSGNEKNVTQNTASKQPKIVSSGSTILKFEKPAIEFNDTTSTTLKLTNYNGADFVDGPCFVTSVSSYTGLGSDQYGTIWHIGMSGSPNKIIANKYVQTSNQVTLGKYDSGYLFRRGGSVSPNTQYINTLDYNGGLDVSFYNNNVLFSSTTGLSADLSNNFVIGGGGADGFNWMLDGHIQEVILYNNSQSSNRTNIETNINDFYSIY